MLLRALDTQIGQVNLQVPAPLAGGTMQTTGVATLTATADPGASQDSTQGYQVGSIVLNATAGFLRWWECRDATAGAAKWVFSGADYANGGTTPSSEVVQFGSGSGFVAAEGNINRQISSAGVSPTSTGVDYVLAAFSLPANSFDVANRGISITAQGSFGTTTNNKTIKIVFNPSVATVGGSIGSGGITVATSGVVATNGSGWSLQANVFKYGVAGSNTQITLHQQSQNGGAVGPLTAPQLATAAESGAILIAVTGNAATAATDSLWNFFEVSAMN
jgi:hypothetical protein